MKLFIQTASGIIALIAGVLFLYLFISGLSKGANFVFLILSFIFIGIGGYLFVKVSKIANTIPESGVEVVSAESGSKLLKKNNQMIEEWSKTNSKEESLKAVQIAASAQQQVAKEQMSS
jgi:hypothetical protein